MTATSPRMQAWGGTLTSKGGERHITTCREDGVLGHVLVGVRERHDRRLGQVRGTFHLRQGLAHNDRRGVRGAAAHVCQVCRGVHNAKRGAVGRTSKGIQLASCAGGRRPAPGPARPTSTSRGSVASAPPATSWPRLDSPSSPTVSSLTPISLVPPPSADREAGRRRRDAPRLLGALRRLGGPLPRARDGRRPSASRALAPGRLLGRLQRGALRGARRLHAGERGVASETSSCSPAALSASRPFVSPLFLSRASSGAEAMATL